MNVAGLFLWFFVEFNGWIQADPNPSQPVGVTDSKQKVRVPLLCSHSNHAGHHVYEPAIPVPPLCFGVHRAAAPLLGPLAEATKKYATSG